jgi:hypothetical protein
MKIVNERVGGPAAPRRPARARDAGDGPAFSALVETGAGESVPESAPVRAATPADAVLAVQQVPDAGVGRRRGLRRGRMILDQLDTIRLALIAGAVPRAYLTKLLTMIESEKSIATDETLSTLLDEIELRARVELAKHGQFETSTPMR